MLVGHVASATGCRLFAWSMGLAQAASKYLSSSWERRVVFRYACPNTCTQETSAQPKPSRVGPGAVVMCPMGTEYSRREFGTPWNIPWRFGRFLVSVLSMKRT